jgi:hypothetical protein
MADITTTIPRADLERVVRYAWSDELADYADQHRVDPERALSHASSNDTSNHIFTALARVALWLEATRPAEPEAGAAA